MPKTAFEMKANLNVKEPKIQKQWDEAKIYQKILEQNKNNNQWILHDGPPYANGNIHVGHALNKILKDIIVRYHLMKGDYSPYIAGWDTHGLPIEHALQKKTSGYNQLSVAQKRDACKNFAIQNVKNQLEQFKRLGMVTDFNEIYLTLEPEFEHDQLLLFLDMVKKNLVFQDYKPVYWSWSSHSALAEAEIEYAEIEADSIYLAFEVVNGNKVLKPGDKIIIWTTTPWTIPSNLAVAAHPDYEYVKVNVNNQNYVVCLDRFPAVAKILGWENYTTSEPFKGIELENAKYISPLTKEHCPIIVDDYVSRDDGTGLVHNAPGFGLEDYFACKKYNINVYCPIDDYGKFDNKVKIKELEGVFYEESNPLIIEMLKKENCLLAHKKIKHSAAVDWRTKKPIMYRATKQWFVNIASIQKELLDAIKDVIFPNETNKNQLTAMIVNRKEWCISRQRVWGVPIPIIFDENKEPIFDQELILNIIDLIKKHGTNAWFMEDVEFFLTDKYKNSGKKFYKEKDIMDVWF
ncbi:MAG: class I tRNA ligase family protein, partial [Malacoplasma sp.]|nr:class I tRNA ligase family protein [Malacoplasma sp.]